MWYKRFWFSFRVCFSVTYADDGNDKCIDGQAAIQNDEGYISNTSPASSSDQDTKQCPWLISALPGQTINVIVIDFQPDQSMEPCLKLGIVRDIVNGHEVAICKSKKREEHLYSTSGPKLKIDFDRDFTDKPETHILVHYKGEIFNVIYAGLGNPEI